MRCAPRPYWKHVDNVTVTVTVIKFRFLTPSPILCSAGTLHLEPRLLVLVYKQVDMFATEGLSLILSGSADGRDGRDGRGISNIRLSEVD